MEKKYVLALDQGTTSSRAIIFDKDQKIFAVSAGNLDFNTLKEMANSVS